jgi:hypothetical protein
VPGVSRVAKSDPDIWERLHCAVLGEIREETETLRVGARITTKSLS